MIEWIGAAVAVISILIALLKIAYNFGQQISEIKTLIIKLDAKMQKEMTGVSTHLDVRLDKVEKNQAVMDERLKHVERIVQA